MDFTGIGIGVATTIIGDFIKSRHKPILNEEEGSNKTVGSNSVLKNFKVNGSIMTLLKTTIVKPTIIITKEAHESSSIDDILALNANIFSSYYLQVFDILTKLYGESAINTINNLSTDIYSERELLKLGGTKILGQAVQGAVSSLRGNTESNIASYNLESLKQPVTLKNLDLSDPVFCLNQEDRDAALSTIGSETVGNKEAGTIKNALVKNITVDIKVGNGSGDKRDDVIVKLPMTIIAMVKVVGREELVTVLSNDSYRASFSYRLNEWRSGGITLGDLIFCNDLIKEYKKRRITKEADLLGKLEQQDRVSTMRHLLTGTKGAEASYNMVIITEDEASILSKVIRKDVMKDNGKDYFLSKMNGFMLSVLNDDTERANIYLRDISGNMDLGYKKLVKESTKDRDILDLMKFLIANRMPNL